MPTKVVSGASIWGDEYVDVPSIQEFDSLRKRVGALRSSVADCATEIRQAADVTACIQQRQEKQEKRIKTLKEDIQAELHNGAWKKELVETVCRATEGLGETLREMNKVTSDRMAELVKHEMAAKKLPEELKDVQAEGVKSIVDTSARIKSEVDSASAQTLKMLESHRTELLMLEEKLERGLKQYCQIETNVSQICGAVTETYRKMEALKATIEEVAEKVLRHDEMRGHGLLGSLKRLIGGIIRAGKKE